LDASTWLIVIIVVFVAAFLFVAIFLGIRAHRNRIAAGREDLVGKTASVEVALEPRGVVLVDGERWTATIDSGRAEPEEEVIVSKVEGLKLTVTRKNK
jgi:membrane-bound serine protease (ClpP class)